MKDLIKEIRRKLDISQEGLAKEMCVSPITISRWENGKDIPSAMAQNQLYAICKKEDIELIDYLVYRDETKDNDRIFYHASRNGIVGDIKPNSRSKCDFGKGFYMGDNPLQPLTLVCDNDKSVFYTLVLDKTNLEILNVEIDLDWALLIAYYRGYMDGYENTSIYKKYSNMTKGYDLVVGYIADDRMYSVLTDFFEGIITDEALVACLSALKLGKQHVAITDKACSQIKIIKERKLEKLDLLLLRDKSIKRRREGKELADEMKRLHRREGRYFDEILKENKPL